MTLEGVAGQAVGRASRESHNSAFLNELCCFFCVFCYTDVHMHKSTLFFACLAIVFALTTAGVTYRLLSEKQSGGALVGGAGLELGLPSSEKTKETSDFRAASALVWDTNTKQIRFEQMGFERHPIASLTKLMTAMVALDHGVPWDQSAGIELDEYVQGGQLLLHPGEMVSMRDLFYASLMSSANNATLAYVRVLDIPEEQFVQEMNRKAVTLGLEQTEFTDVTGLDVGNISTAYDVARLAETAFRDYPEIARATSQKEYSFVVGGSGREHTIRNSNKLITEAGEAFAGSKTGYLYEARYCLVVQGSGETGGKIAVVLGSPSESENLADVGELLHRP